MRVQNEESVEAAIISALRLADEVICVDNGSTDKTLDIAKSIAAKDNRVRVFEYPFKCFDSGPSHMENPNSFIHAFFYNWCFSLAGFSHAWKWDGECFSRDRCNRKKHI